MDDDNKLAEFTSITSATPERAQQYLTLSDGNLEQAIQLFFESGGVDMGASYSTEQQQPPRPPPAQPPTAGTGASSGNAGEPIRVDSDDDSEGGGIPVGDQAPTATDDDEAMARRLQEDDEAMARRLQEEAYGAGGGGGSGGTGGDGMDIDPETGVRRPMARTQETLAGPAASFGGFADDEDLRQSVREQVMMRQARSAPHRPPGIFNQRPPPQSNAVWDNEEIDGDSRQQNLARMTGGASTANSKTNRLAEMYRPPFELMSEIRTWDGLRAAGKEEEKWILLNVQNSNVFDCQVLNRDIWKHDEIKSTVKENFVFKQYTKEDPQASQYIQYYFKDHESEDAYPHIAIVDPRTGEQVKVWSGPPVPKPVEFLTQLHEFLDRYSLSAHSKNPVATRKADRRTKDVEKMSEEEMLEMAMQASLQRGSQNGQRKASDAMDPDLLTKQNGSSQGTNGDAGTHTKAVPKAVTPFDKISASNPHTEPEVEPQSTTRIQFRHPAGRVVRRFATKDKVSRMYEWLKAAPFESREGQPFELVFMGKNLIESVEAGETIEDAGLKNGSVMVEFIEE